ncbi:hypothetical protein SAMN02745166_03581 [Prosthecobacter debontii]|uniref:Uncharacterized protein n=1 Tax=Prosthecobacter debontii TaxID=48467 RepID=A0A1T4YKJ4_9BACT|nr:hypothetical protein [Prosthecobacter debontii]SKB02213.1 hypothetical protein SAMN02745166_03581 [Prosthecobacter debontii]
MHTPAPLASSEVAFASFDLVSFGEILVPDHPLRFGFQYDVVPSQTGSQNIILALTAVAKIPGTEQSCTRGFAVKVDLVTGEVWDLLNDSGLVGWIERPMDTFTDEEPMLLNWEVEHYGAALIPKLQIGGEVFLYPALRYTDGMVMDTVAGLDIGQDPASTFMHPAVWKESL